MPAKIALLDDILALPYHAEMPGTFPTAAYGRGPLAAL